LLTLPSVVGVASVVPFGPVVVVGPRVVGVTPVVVVAASVVAVGGAGGDAGVALGAGAEHGAEQEGDDEAVRAVGGAALLGAAERTASLGGAQVPVTGRALLHGATLEVARRRHKCGYGDGIERGRAA
jgi:hypothetical protein